MWGIRCFSARSRAFSTATSEMAATSARGSFSNVFKCNSEMPPAPTIPKRHFFRMVSLHSNSSQFHADDPFLPRRLQGGQNDAEGLHPLLPGNERRRPVENALQKRVDHAALRLPAFLVGGDGPQPVFFHLAVGPLDDQRLLRIGTDADQTLFAVKVVAVVIAGNIGLVGAPGEL